MIGERGGTTRSLQEADALFDEHKAHWKRTIKARIAAVLRDTGAFHADDLVGLEIPAAHKNVIGACVGAAVRKGIMEETPVRRRTSDPAGHGRRSPVYRITDLGRAKLAGSSTTESRGGGAGSGQAVPDGGERPGVNTGPPSDASLRLFPDPPGFLDAA